MIIRKRFIAMKWWNGLSYDRKIKVNKGYHHTKPENLTGRQIQRTYEFYLDQRFEKIEDK